TINALSSSLSAQDAWVNLGGLTAQVQPPGSGALLHTTTSAANTGANIAQQLGGLTSAIHKFQQLPGLPLAITAPSALLTLLTGEKATLFSYTLPDPHISVSAIDKQLAAIPVSPETATEVDIDLHAGLTVSGGATFGFDTSGFQAGNLAKGFFI